MAVGVVGVKLSRSVDSSHGTRGVGRRLQMVQLAAGVADFCPSGFCRANRGASANAAKSANPAIVQRRVKPFSAQVMPVDPCAGQDMPAFNSASGDRDPANLKQFLGRSRGLEERGLESWPRKVFFRGHRGGHVFRPLPF
jgi:hypothetical protein